MKEEDLSKIKIEELNLSVRSYKALKYFAHIDTVEQVIQLSKEELLSIRSLGIVSYNEIMEKVEEYKKGN